MEAAILAQMMLDEDDAEADEDLLLAAVLEEAQQNPFLHRPVANSYSSYDHRSTFEELLPAAAYPEWLARFRPDPRNMHLYGDEGFEEHLHAEKRRRQQHDACMLEIKERRVV